MSSLSLIKGGHAKEAAQSSGCRSSLVCESAPSGRHSQQQGQQVHRKLAGVVGGATTIAGNRWRGEHGSVLSKRAVHNVRLLSIISALIVIAVLSRECGARAYFGPNPSGGEHSYEMAGDNYDSYAMDGASLLSNCQGLIDAMASSSDPRDRSAISGFARVAGKRVNPLPKITPRFGR